MTKLKLSQETLDKIVFPLEVAPKGYHEGAEILDANGDRLLMVIGWNTNDAEDIELANFIAAMLEAALSLAEVEAGGAVDLGESRPNSLTGSVVITAYHHPTSANLETD